jgi:exosortase/archaeosortase family protein
MSRVVTLPTSRPARARLNLTALSLALTGILLLVLGEQVRTLEAWVQATALDLFGIAATAVRETVMVRLPSGLGVGIRITPGCSVGPLLATFLLGSSPFVWYRSLGWRCVLTAVAQLAVVLVAANQMRIAVIVGSMQLWGIHRGYEVSHVFLGSTITTIGFVLGALLFVRLLLRQEPAQR